MYIWAPQFSVVRAPPVATLVSSFHFITSLLWAPPVATQFSVLSQTFVKVQAPPVATKKFVKHCTVYFGFSGAPRGSQGAPRYSQGAPKGSLGWGGARWVTGLFYPRSASLDLSTHIFTQHKPLWASPGLSGPLCASLCLSEALWASLGLSGPL